MEKSVKYGSLANARKLAPVNPGAFVGNASLFSRLGGETVLADLVRDFYAKAAGNEQLKKFFDPTDNAQLLQRTAYLIAAFGGPNNGVDIRITTRLVALGIGNEQFDAVAEVLSEVLKNKGIEYSVAEEVLAFNESVRKNVMR